MGRLKGNTGALLLFIGTIIIAISAVLGVITTVFGLGAVMEAAAQVIRDAGGADSEIEMAKTIAMVTAIVVLVISVVIDLLVIIPGFKYSLQGKAKTWAFVMSIICIISVVASLINSLRNLGALASTLVSAAGLILYIIGVFMLRKKEA